MDQTLERFFSKVLPANEQGCMLYTGALHHNGGHGKFFARGKTMLAHRYAYELAYGEIPTGLCVCHSCDVPNCVNPKHLWLGTVRENTLDAKVKGRLAHGNRCHLSKLSSEQVKEIRLSLPHKTDAAIARQFAVVTATIWFIRHGVTWKELIQ